MVVESGRTERDNLGAREWKDEEEGGAKEWKD